MDGTDKFFIDYLFKIVKLKNNNLYIFQGLVVPETTEGLFKQLSNKNNIKDKKELYINYLNKYIKYI